MRNHHPKPLTRLLSALLCVCTVLSPLGNSAYAQTIIPLPDVPFALGSKVKPNVVFSLDNSGSMDWLSVTGFDGQGQYTGNNRNTRAFFSKDYNRLAYNTALTYTPPVNWQNMSMGNAPVGLARNDPFPTIGGVTTTTNVAATCAGITDSLNTALPTAANCGTGATVARLAYYYNWDGVTTINNTATPGDPAFTSRVDIIPGRTYPRAVTRTDCNTTPDVLNPTRCSYDQEIQNFANWYSYYRSRILMTKTVLGQVFAGIDENTSATNPPQFRIGFNAINDADGASAATTNGNYWLDTTDFTATQKQAFFNILYRMDTPASTPLRLASDRIGKLFSGTLAGVTAARNPVQYSCQQNYHILSTDGFWNDSFTLPTGRTNLDGAATLPLGDGTTMPVTAPYRDASNSANTLADVTLHYWAKDLRDPAVTGTVCTSPVTGADLCANNVKPNSKDPATWQHTTTFTVGLGASGDLNYQGSIDNAGNYDVTPQGDYAQILNGTRNWPAIPAGGNVRQTIDDLWHAAVNGRGTYFNAGDPTNLKRGLTNALLNISARQGADAGFSLDAPGISDDSGAYVVKYNSADWSGSLAASQIALDGSGTVTLTEKWNARDKITEQAAGTGWNTNRKIVTLDGTNKIPFRWANLSAAQKTSLGAAADQQDVVDYLRGKNVSRFRPRTYLLGDIVGSEAVVVGAPKEAYRDGLGNDGYESWKGSKLERAPRIYVGANDGMLHAIDASLASGGKELWAYVPSMLFAGPNNTPAVDGLAALATPGLFKHHFYVDQTPVYKDVDFSRTKGVTGATPDWRTILVGGLNKGGKGFYALDITDPDAAATEAATATAKVLWEFTDADMGFSYGQPQIAKTRKHGWVVMVSSGLNNSGNGYLYILDVKTGALLEKISTGTNPGGGMREITGWVPSAGDYTVEQVYGGDMNGNVWRFDLSQPASNTSPFPAPTLMATLKDAAGQPQPITTAPRIDLVGANDRWIIVGTGKLLSVGDELNTQQQTMYVFRDGDKALPYVNPGDTRGAPFLPGGLSFPLNARGSSLVSINDSQLTSNNSALLSGKMGWFHDFSGIDTTSGGTERIHINPVVRNGLLSWSTSTAQGSNVCATGLTGRIYVAGIADAKSRVLAGNAPSGATLAFSQQTAGVVKLRIVSTKDGKDRLLAQDAGGSIISINADMSPAGSGAKRLNWREIK